MCLTGAVDMIMRMFPPFPIPDFAPNMTGYDWDQYGIDWYETYREMSQSPRAALFWVSISYTY